MIASRDALIRAVDALEGPQRATREEPVAPAKCLENQAGSHTDHRGHSETIDHVLNQKHAGLLIPGGEQRRRVPPPKVYPSSVAPVAHVAPGIDFKGKNQGHTDGSCGPLWPPPGFPRVSAPAGVPDEWLAGAARLPMMAQPRDYPAPAWRQLMIDAERFLDLWGTQAASLGWRDWELFGCHRRAPWGRIQGMGLVLLLRGKEIAALTATESVLHAGIGARQTYHRKPRDPLHPAERCLIWELDNG